MANELHLELIRGDEEALRLWIAENPMQSFDLSSAHLKNLDILDVNFSGADFSDAIIEHSFLDDCNFESANFRNCTLTGVSMTDSQFLKTCFVGAQLDGLNADGSKIESCNFDRAMFASCNFRSVKITNSNFKRCNFKVCDFDDSVIIGSDFSESYLISTSFIRSKISIVDFSDVGFRYCQFVKIDIDDTCFEFSVFIHALFDQARLQDSTFGNTTFIGGEVTDFRCNQSKFYGPIIADSCFLKALNSKNPLAVQIRKSIDSSSLIIFRAKTERCKILSRQLRLAGLMHFMEDRIQDRGISFTNIAFQKTTLLLYTKESALSFQDELSDANIVGIPVVIVCEDKTRKISAKGDYQVLSIEELLRFVASNAKE